MENGSRRKHMAKPSFCQSQQHEKKKKKKHIWKNTDTRLQPDLFSLLHLNSRNFMNGKCQGIGFPKPLWPASHELTMLFWWVHAVWSSDGAPPEGRDPRAPPHPLCIMLFDLQRYSYQPELNLSWNHDTNKKKCIGRRSEFKDNNILD